MDRAEFEQELLGQVSEQDIRRFCQNRFLHGTPFLFRDREDELFNFKARVSEKFEVGHQEVFIVGSSKFGFSPYKGTDFSLDSDVDVAIVSPALVEKIDRIVLALEYDIRSWRVSVTPRNWERYHSFLRYRAIGWVRPDLIPPLAAAKVYRAEWFDFFGSISYEKSEVGNYKVSAAAYQSIDHLEEYCFESAKKIKSKLMTQSARSAV